MTDAKKKLDTTIGKMVAASVPHRSIARRLLLYDFNHVFTSDPDRGFQILNTICEYFKLPFSAVKVVGSAQTGYSYYSEHDFRKGDSDLDIAIISPFLFQEYSQTIYWMTQRYTDQTKFPRKEGVSVAQDFRLYLGSGLFRPDLMPECTLKANWLSFFNRLSTKHTDVFRNINAAIYLSEGFFEMKNASIVEAYRKAGQ
ncbi:MAG TPA: hypothetical protein VJW20_10790 [Candidatus Angelobacter sp.]|nr:hypothetical protein [Candidatus Angelobacter sp.]